MSKMTTMDALFHILNIIQLSAQTYTCRGVGNNWNIQFQYRPQGIFHLILQGKCYLRETGSDELLLLQAGDGVTFPTGGAHLISDSPESQGLSAANVIHVPGDDGLLLMKTGNVSISHSQESSHEGTSWSAVPPSEDASRSQEETVLLSGVLSYDSAIDHPFLKSLPCFIQAAPRTDFEIETNRALTRLLAAESSTDFPGKPLMVDRLTEILVVQLLRTHMRKMQHSNGYMAALADPHIGAALNLIHTETDKKWTVESLCKAAAMGRTAFTQKFVDMVGTTPKAYLTNTRLLKAKVKLQTSHESTQRIAEGAGYSSEAAFSKAFKKHFNKTPWELRKES